MSDTSYADARAAVERRIAERAARAAAAQATPTDHDDIIREYDAVAGDAEAAITELEAEMAATAGRDEREALLRSIKLQRQIARVARNTAARAADHG